MSAEVHRAVAVERHAQLVWLDPGVTTGAVVISIRPQWLAGDGAPNWSGLGKAVTMSWHGQVGREPKVWNADRDKAAAASGGKAVRKPGRSSVSGDLAALVDVGKGRNGGGELRDYVREEIRQLAQIQALLELWPDAAWGYEDFIPNQANAAREFLAPVRLFAALTYAEAVFSERGRTPFVQGASMAKSTATDDRLKAAGLYRAGMPHATDAARHAATFLRRCRHDAELRAAAWPRLFRSRAA